MQCRWWDWCGAGHGGSVAAWMECSAGSAVQVAMQTVSVRVVNSRAVSWLAAEEAMEDFARCRPAAHPSIHLWMIHSSTDMHHYPVIHPSEDGD